MIEEAVGSMIAAASLFAILIVLGGRLLLVGLAIAAVVIVSILIFRGVRRLFGGVRDGDEITPFSSNTKIFKDSKETEK